MRLQRRFAVTVRLWLGDCLSSTFKVASWNASRFGEADVTYMRWRNSSRVLLGAHRGFETVVLECDASNRELTQSWASDKLGSGDYIRPIPFGNGRGDSAFMVEDYRKAPHLAIVRTREKRTLNLINSGIEAQIQDWVNKVEPVCWPASDGLNIQGWLLLPKGEGPFPLVMHIHGGPVCQWHRHWLGRTSWGLTNVLLLRHGYAVFQPEFRARSGFRSCVAGR